MNWLRRYQALDLLIAILVAIVVLAIGLGITTRHHGPSAHDMLDTLVEAHYDGVPIDCGQKDLWVRAAKALHNGSVQPPAESNCQNGAMSADRANEQRFCHSSDPDDYCPPEGRR